MWGSPASCSGYPEVSDVACGMAPAGRLVNTRCMSRSAELVAGASRKGLTSTLATARRLVGRASELEVLYGLVERGGAVVVPGEPGIGKTSLLRAASRHASESGVLVLGTAGVQSEAGLACSCLHQLFSPVLAGLDRSAADRLGRLPGPQRDALETAFGLAAGAAPDRFLLGLAVLGLLADVAKERRLLCIIDDAQWLDAASAQALTFAARRLSSEAVAMVFAVRVPNDNRELIGLPELMVAGLDEEDARALLATVIPGRLDGRVRDRIVAEARRNPLALLEAARTLSAAELAGGFALPETGRLAVGGEQRRLQDVDELPYGIRQLMLLAAADVVGDAALILRAAKTLKIEPGIVARAEDEQLLEIGIDIRFRSPRLRAAVYRAATTAERRAAHAALSTASEREFEPDRRAWHRAHAAPVPDEGIADDLARRASRAERRGGIAAAATFLEYAAALTPDPSRRASRTLSAAQAKFEAGDLEDAETLLAIAEVGPLSQLGQAQIQRVRGQMAFELRHSREAPSVLLGAAQRMETLDVGLARMTYLEGFVAANDAAELGKGTDMVEIARAARSVTVGPEPLQAAQFLLRGLTTRFLDGYAAAAPTLRTALSAHRSEPVHLDRLCVIYNLAAMDLWDDHAWLELASSQVKLARTTGTLSLLPRALAHLADNHTQAGELTRAAEILGEAENFGLGGPALHAAQLSLAAWRGRASSAAHLTDLLRRDERDRGERRSIAGADYAMAIFHNGLGHYDLAFENAQKASASDVMGTSSWALSELVEAAARSGHLDVAGVALARLSERTVASGTVWAKGTEARSRALVEDGELAEHLHRQAIDWLGQCRMAGHLARARLIYGEWLRRANRRVDAREQLRTAYGMFAAMGADGFANRAQHELLATGEKLRKRQAETRDDLTPQEAQIARLARDGRTNPEIGRELFISPRTVEWHLRKVFIKLGITSRNDIHRALPTLELDAAPV
jgi:DNA-binding CsgD family transcriptional regulator